MKKLLILQMRPEDAAAESEFEAILGVAGISPDQVHRVRVEATPKVALNLEDYFAIVAGGSPFDVSMAQPEKSDQQLAVEAFFDRLFNQVIPLDIPFLGCCSGNGLLGKYCGTPISGKYSEPVGSTMIKITASGKKDALLKGLPETFRVMVGHKEACDSVPQEAVLLATSAKCPVQMFRIKNNIYATQFHPEADENEFVLRIRTYRDHGYFPPETANDLIREIENVETPHAKEILKRFVRKYHPH